MDDIRVGRIVRALRRRLGWRQSDLAKRANVSQQTVSILERGHAQAVSLRALRSILGTLDASASIEVRWRGGELDRLLDRGHSAVGAGALARLERLGWEARPEVTYSVFGERGSVDLLAWRAPQRALLVVEVKTDVVSLEATLRKLDEKVRLAPDIARDRFAWQPRTTSRLLVLPETRTARRCANLPLLLRAYATRSGDLRAWLREPTHAMAGVLFVAVTSVSSASRRIDPPRAVRIPAEARVGREEGLSEGDRKDNPGLELRGLVHAETRADSTSDTRPTGD